MTTEPVPREQAVLRIAADSLWRLPERAVYTESSGRATATLSRHGDTIVVYADCDSLQRLVEWYSVELSALYARHLSDSVSVTTKEHTNVVRTPLERMLEEAKGVIFLLSIIFLMAVWPNHRNKKTE